MLFQQKPFVVESFFCFFWSNITHHTQPAREGRPYCASAAPAAYARNWRRDYASEDTLSRGAAPAAAARAAAAAEGDASRPHFVLECFLSAQRAMHECLMPAVRRFEESVQMLQQRALAASG